MKGKLTTRLAALEAKAVEEALRSSPPIVLIHDGRKLPSPPYDSPYPVMHIRFRSKAGIVEGGKLVRRDAVKKRRSKQQKRRNIQ